MAQSDKPCIACGRAHRPGPCPVDPLAPHPAAPADDSSGKVLASLQLLAGSLVMMRESLAELAARADRQIAELWDIYNGIDQERRRGKT